MPRFGISVPRVVLDTNVWLSALIFGGNPREVVELFVRQQIHVVASEELFTEIRRKVWQKFPLFAGEAVELEQLIRETAGIVKLGSITIQKTRDVKDNYILEMAVLGECTHIVTGDKDLLVLQEFKQIKIVKPVGFLR